MFALIPDSVKTSLHQAIRCLYEDNLTTNIPGFAHIKFRECCITMAREFEKGLLKDPTILVSVANSWGAPSLSATEALMLAKEIKPNDNITFAKHRSYWGDISKKTYDKFSGYQNEQGVVWPPKGKFNFSFHTWSTEQLRHREAFHRQACHGTVDPATDEFHLDAIHMHTFHHREGSFTANQIKSQFSALTKLKSGGKPILTETQLNEILAFYAKMEKKKAQESALLHKTLNNSMAPFCMGFFSGLLLRLSKEIQAGENRTLVVYCFSLALDLVQGLMLIINFFNSERWLLQSLFIALKATVGSWSNITYTVLVALICYCLLSMTLTEVMFTAILLPVITEFSYCIGKAMGYAISDGFIYCYTLSMAPHRKLKKD